MKFVFNLDGTLSFDYKEIKQVLLQVSSYRYEVLFTPVRFLLGLFRGFLVDDQFDYRGKIVEKIPFIVRVGPLKVAQYQQLEDL